MARTKFRAEVLTPEGQVFDDEVEMVATRTTVGVIAILARHQPLLGLLDPTELRLYRSEGEVERYAQGEGYIQMTGESVLILCQEAVPPDDLDASELRDRLQRAEQDVQSAEEDSEEQRLAVREQRRLEAFLRITEGAKY